MGFANQVAWIDSADCFGVGAWHWTKSPIQEGNYQLLIAQVE